MSNEELLIAGGIFVVAGLLIAWWTNYKKIFLCSPNQELGRSLNHSIKMRHVCIGVFSCFFFLSTVSFVLPHLPTLSSFGWSLFFADLLFLSFLLFYICNEKLDSIFLQGKKYVLLGLYIYILYLPWLGIAKVLNLFVLHELYVPTESARNFFHHQMEWDTPIFYALAISSSFISPISEEILFRGFFQNFITRVFGSLSGLIVTSLFFSLVHYKFGKGLSNVEIVLHAFIFSLFIGYLYQKTNSIVSCISFHMLNNSLAYISLIIERL